jgi:hypothetical protein
MLASTDEGHPGKVRQLFYTHIHWRKALRQCFDNYRKYQDGESRHQVPLGALSVTDFRDAAQEMPGFADLLMKPENSSSKATIILAIGQKNAGKLKEQSENS